MVFDSNLENHVVTLDSSSILLKKCIRSNDWSSIFIGLNSSKQHVVVKIYPGYDERFASYQKRVYKKIQTLPFVESIITQGMCVIQQRNIYVQIKELIHGWNILEFTRFFFLSPVQKLILLKSVVWTIAKIHENGIIHMDLKPPHIRIQMCDHSSTENIFSVSFRIRLIDFDSCFFLEDLSMIQKAISQRNIEHIREMLGQYGPPVFVGTQGYMSPEQEILVMPGIPFEHKEKAFLKFSQKSDIYSLGKIFLNVFGIHSFDELREREPFVPQSVIHTLSRTQEREPMNRPSAEELLRELDTWIEILKQHPLKVDDIIPLYNETPTIELEDELSITKRLRTIRLQSTGTPIILTNQDFELDSERIISLFRLSHHNGNWYLMRISNEPFQAWFNGDIMETHALHRLQSNSLLLIQWKGKSYEILFEKFSSCIRVYKTFHAYSEQITQ